MDQNPFTITRNLKVRSRAQVVPGISRERAVGEHFEMSASYLFLHIYFWAELAIDVLKSYRPTTERPERDMTSLKKLRQEMLEKEEEVNGLSQQLTKQQEECRVIREQLEKEKKKQQKFQETTRELVSWSSWSHLWER